MISIKGKPMIEQAADYLADALRTAHKGADPVLACALLPLLADACELRDRVRELSEAIKSQGE